MRDPTDIAAQQQSDEDLILSRQQARRQEIADFKAVADTKQGRRFLWRLLEQSGQFISSMTGNSQTFANEGRRQLGLVLVHEFHEHSLDAYLKMVKENMSE